MANQTGTLYSYNVDQTGNTVPSAVGASADLRRIHNFGDRVAELAPDESPFFVYLNKVAKVPTNDPVFRFLENRSKIDWTSRNFYIDGTALTDVAADSQYTITVDDNASSEQHNLKYYLELRVLPKILQILL